MFTKRGLPILLAILPLYGHAQPQNRQHPGRSIGAVSTQGNLIVMELNEGALGKANLFDLDRRTLRFTPEGSGYRAENLALRWDAVYGAEMTDPLATLRNFAFPFSGKNWDSFSVGVTGSIVFGFGQNGASLGGRGGGVTIGRFDQLQDAARTLINTVPAICVFMKPRMSGHRYLKELADRVVITWDLTEPYGGIQDFTWVPTVNRFQAALRRDGSIEMSYDQLAARDAIVGLYPIVSGGAETLLAALADEEDPAAAPHLGIRSLKIAAVDGLFLKIMFETRGPVVPEGNAELTGVQYRIYFHAHKPLPTRMDREKADLVWTIRGMGADVRGGGRDGGPRYIASGAGVSPGVKIGASTISLQGVFPAAFSGVEEFAVSADVIRPGTAAAVDEVIPRAIRRSGLRSPEVDLSAVKAQDGPFAIAYEAFHYYALPNPRDLACTVIQALGDNFDFLAYYADFRVDNQEAGTPSTGPLGGNVTGIGHTQRGIESYCSAGRFQWQFVQPIYAGSNQMQERPPEGVVSSNSRDIAFYQRQLGEQSPEGRMGGYNYAISQIAHEMGHRWGAFVSAKIKGEMIALGPTHWARGLQAAVAFPYQRPIEASAMGGGVWQDNFDGTYTQLDDDYYVPATGWSHLDLYLMGLVTAAEVPDFFLLRNLVPAGRDANGHPIFKAERLKVRIQDVIEAEGPRLPGVDQSQRKFNTGMVAMVTHGAKPSRELVGRTNAIREKWIEYWTTTTGGRASMTARAR